MSCRSSPNLIFWTVAQTGKVTPLVPARPAVASPEPSKRSQGRWAASATR